MRIWTTFALFVLTCGSLALVACGGGSGNSNTAGGSNKGGCSAPTVNRQAVPEDVAAMQSATELSNADFIANGKKLFEDTNGPNCVMCHGASGKGDGIAAASYTDPAVTDLTDAAFQDAVTDQYIFWRIAKPNDSKAYPTSGMQGNVDPNATDEDNWALTAYVRSLKGK